MTTQFNSFDSSRVGGFVESPLHARNRRVLPAEGTIDPIIFIVASVRDLLMEYWRSGGAGAVPLDEWTQWRQTGDEYVGAMHYTHNPGSFASDLAHLQDTLHAHENFDYRSVGKAKPNWQIWLWQPRATSFVRAIDQTAIYSVTNFAGLYEGATAQLLNVDSSSFLTGDDYPDSVPIANIYPLPIETVAFQVRAWEHGTEPEFHVTELLPGAPNSTIALHLPGLGEPIATSHISWRQQSLISAWDAVVRRYESLSPVFRGGDPVQNRAEVHMKIQLEFREWFMRPFTSTLFGRTHGDVPTIAVKERMREDLPEGIDELRVITGNMSAGARWLAEAESIIRSRMR